MSKVCQVTGKRPQSGNNVSHAHNKTRRRFLPNLQSKRFWIESEKRYVRLRVSHKGLRIIDKHGIDKVHAFRITNSQGVAIRCGCHFQVLSRVVGVHGGLGAKRLAQVLWANWCGQERSDNTGAAQTPQGLGA